MRLEVHLTVRRQTHQTSFRCLERVARAVVTWHLSWFDWGIVGSYLIMFLEILHNLPESGVDTKFEPFVELLFAQRTLTLLFAFPVPGDTGLAKVVSTWNRNRLGENLQTDGAQELILRQETAGCGHI